MKPTTLNIGGTLSTDPVRPGWLRVRFTYYLKPMKSNLPCMFFVVQEGMPPLFPLIDNFVLYVETDDTGGYNATIRYSCEENYNIPTPPFHFKLFESIQIWTREKVPSQSTLDRLFAKAVDMGIIALDSFDTYKNLTYAGC